MGIDSRQIMKQKCRIFHIGLARSESLVIRSLFRLAPELNEKFVFGEPTEDDQVDLMFVNGDDVISLKQWDAISKSRPEVVPILVVSEERNIPGIRMIKKPLAFKKFVQILELITSAESSVNLNAANGKLPSTRVLVVDDSFPARQYMKFKLEELTRGIVNVTVDFAESGEAAVSAIENQAYDLAFLDVVLPGMDGYETCRKIRRVQKLRVVMLTGQKTTLDKMQAKVAGSEDYLTKPPADSELRRIFEELANSNARAVA